jgi:hypothetical protein
MNHEPKFEEKCVKKVFNKLWSASKRQKKKTLIQSSWKLWIKVSTNCWKQEPYYTFWGFNIQAYESFDKQRWKANHATTRFS